MADQALPQPGLVVKRGDERRRVVRTVKLAIGTFVDYAEGADPGVRARCTLERWMAWAQGGKARRTS